MKQERGITLVALIVTIILLLILAGLGISLAIGNNGIIQYAQTAQKEYSQAQAREELETTLLDLQIDKTVKSNYNQKEYINRRLQEQGYQIEDDVVTVGQWKFQIDRSVPQIIQDVSPLSPKIVDCKVIPLETEIRVLLEVQNEEDITITYTIKVAGKEELQTTQDIKELEYTFTNLQKGVEYEITVEISNQYGKHRKVLTATTQDSIVVPIMNDYLSEEGKVIYSPQQADRYPAWQCFDGENSTGFAYNYQYPCYVGYEFNTDKELLIYKVGLAGRYNECPKDFKIKVYHNGEWVTVYSGVMQNPTQDYAWQYFDIDTIYTGQKFMVEFTSSYHNTECSIRNIQFYTVNMSK